MSEDTNAVSDADSQTQADLTAFADTETGTAAGDATATDSAPPSAGATDMTSPPAGLRDDRDGDVDAPLQPSATYSCPWCLRPPRVFVETVAGETACGHCDAIIPIETDWYHQGEKIASVRGAVHIYGDHET